jgi:hypothetical protein
VFFFLSRKKSRSLTFSHFLSTFSLLSFFLFSHIRERERDGERERESLFFRRLGKEEEELSGALSLSLCFSLSRCDAYRSDRRECRPRERREKATAASTSEI